MYDRGLIPRELQPSLVQRLNSFVEAQGNNQPDKLAEMLGPFSSGVSRREYAPEEKEWVVQKLMERSLMSFTPLSVSFSTANLNRPFNKRWWYVEGEGKFRNSGKEEKVVMAVYRHNSEWYFEPMVVTEYGWEPLFKPASNNRVKPARR